MEIKTNRVGFITTHGLKVRLDYDYCSDHMNEDGCISWDLSIEAFDSLPRIISIIITIGLMFSHVEPIRGGIIIFFTYTIALIVSQSYICMSTINFIYGFIYMLYQFLQKLFIAYITLILADIITKEYWLLLSFVVSRLLCFLLQQTVNICLLKHN
jgi:hypothetical protein